MNGVCIITHDFLCLVFAGGLPPGLGSMFGGGGAGGLPDFGAVLNNPAMMQMASQMMQTPGMQQMYT